MTSTEMVAVAITLQEYKRLLELETRVKVLEEIYRKDGVIVTDDVTSILKFEERGAE